MPIALIKQLPGWDLDGVELVAGVQVAHVTARTKPDACGSCGGDADALRRHGTVVVNFVEQPCAGLPTRLSVTRRRYRCRFCGRVVGQPLPLTIPSPRFTKRCVEYVREQYPLVPTVKLAERIGADDTSVRAVGAAVASRRLGRPRRDAGQTAQCSMCLAVLPAPEIAYHHPVPLSRGGTMQPILLCRRCNATRALQWLEDRP